MSEFKEFSELKIESKKLEESTGEINLVKFIDTDEDLEPFPSFKTEENIPTILKRNYRFEKDKDGNKIEIVTIIYENGAKVVTTYKAKGQTSKTEISYKKSIFTVETEGRGKRWG